MVGYITPILEFSRDPLSDTTPTWVDITAYLLEAKWSSGIQEPGDDPQPGQAVFVLDDRTRRFEPDYASGAYYPDIVPMRRFRWRITSSAVTYDEGIWYAASWQPTWPDRVTNQETIVQCVDGFGVLAQDDLPLLDPPDADDYPGVISFDGAWGYWRLGEEAGTQVVSQVRTVVRGKGKKRRKVKRRTSQVVTTAEVSGVSGPSGVYRNTPMLAQEGLILGDADTAVAFGAASTEYVEIATDTDNFRTNCLSVECWTSFPGSAVDQVLVSGPQNAGGDSVFALIVTSTESINAVFTVGGVVTQSPSGVGETVDTPHHVVGVLDGGWIRIYVDGVLENETAVSGTIDAPAANPRIYIGRGDIGAGFVYATCLVDEVAIYECVLTPERILAHYEAGSARGYPMQTAGERIAAISTSDLWAETGIQTAGRNVQPMMQHGQPKLGEIAELAHAEGPKTLFYFNGTGGPEYRGWEWQASSSSYNTVQAIFGNAGGAEVPFEDIALDYDDEVYNKVVVSHESGELAEATDTVSEGQIGPRTNPDWTDVLLMEHTDVVSLAGHVLDYYKTPAFRPTSLELAGEDTTSRLHIFARKIGHLVEVKHRPGGGTVIDRVAHIIGWEKSLARETGQLEATFHLDRGFKGDDGFWHAGIVGLSEAGTETVAA